jgi:hypothetical protein
MATYSDNKSFFISGGSVALTSQNFWAVYTVPANSYFLLTSAKFGGGFGTSFEIILPGGQKIQLSDIQANIDPGGDPIKFPIMGGVYLPQGTQLRYNNNFSGAPGTSYIHGVLFTNSPTP